MSQTKIGPFFIGRQINENEWLAHAVVNDSRRYAIVKISDIEDSHEVDELRNQAPDVSASGDNEANRRLSRPKQILGVLNGSESEIYPTWSALGESPRVMAVGNSSDGHYTLKKRALNLLKRFRKSTAFVAGVLFVAGFSAVVFAPNSSTEHVAASERPSDPSTHVAPTPTISPVRVTGEWFRSELSKRPSSQTSLRIASEINWIPEQELASRLISQSGDVSLYALCDVDSKAKSHCVNVVVETDPDGNHIRETIKPAT